MKTFVNKQPLKSLRISLKFGDFWGTVYERQEIGGQGEQCKNRQTWGQSGTRTMGDEGR